MFIKRKFKGFLALMLAMIVSLAAGCAGNDTKSTASGNGSEQLPKEIRFGYQMSPNGELLAKALGSVEKKYPGVKVSWIKFDSGRDINTAIASGSIDFGLVGTPPAASGIANNLPYDIYYLHDIIGESEALVVKKDSGINLIKDLKGKKIATAFSSTAHFSLLNALKLNGVKDSEVTLLDMQMPDIAAAWQRNDIAGAYVWQPTQAKLLADGGKVIISSKELAEQGAITGEVGIVHKDFAKKYPNVVKGYISILNDSVHYYKEHQQESAKALSKELGLSESDTLKAMNEIVVLDSKEQTYSKYLGTKDKPGDFGKLLKDTADYLVTQKSIKAAPDLVTYQKALRTDLYN